MVRKPSMLKQPRSACLHLSFFPLTIAVVLVALSDGFLTRECVGNPSGRWFQEGLSSRKPSLTINLHLPTSATGTLPPLVSLLDALPPYLSTLDYSPVSMPAKSPWILSASEGTLHQSPWQALLRVAKPSNLIWTALSTLSKVSQVQPFRSRASRGAEFSGRYCRIPSPADLLSLMIFG